MQVCMCGCIGSSLQHTGFLQLQRAGAILRCGVQTSHCGGFSCSGAQALSPWASVVVACRLSSCGSWALERRLSICGAQAQLLHGMWDLPGPGIEPVSPALAGRFLTTAPPGKSPNFFINWLFSTLSLFSLSSFFLLILVFMSLMFLFLNIYWSFGDFKNKALRSSLDTWWAGWSLLTYEPHNEVIRPPPVFHLGPPNVNV